MKALVNDGWVNGRLLEPVVESVNQEGYERGPGPLLFTVVPDGSKESMTP
jgi:hypothetical protein